MFGKRKNITPNAPESKRTTGQGRPSSTRSTDSQTSYSSAYSAAEENSQTLNNSAASSTITVTGITNWMNSLKIDRKTAPAHNFGGTKTGQLRDIIEIDILLIDGEEYKGNILEMEVHQYICRETLKLKRSSIVAIDLSWAGHPLATVRLNERIDIDRLPKHFTFEKPGRDNDGKLIKHQIICEIRGVKDESMANIRRMEEEDDNTKTRWVKVEGVGFDLTEVQIQEWLGQFGSVLSDLETEVMTFEDKVADSDDDENTNKMVSISRGILSCKMKIVTEIPQILPAYGRRMKVYYRGIDKQCTKCFQNDHVRANCTRISPKPWIEYVSEFIAYYDKIPTKLYGKWFYLARAYEKTQKPTNGGESTENGPQ
jgi:hypothetical protein